MAKPNLLLCFDAFGTLFRPKGSVGKQYAEVARQCGLGGFSDEQMHTSLTEAIKRQMRLNPNYGKDNGLGAIEWWTKVIHMTMEPYAGVTGTLPKDLCPKLLQRFASSEGYEADSELVPTIRALKSPSHLPNFGKIIIGVITNSDDRVPDVLSSIGLRVSPLRYGTHLDTGTWAHTDNDVDFHCMSYDCGVEKPDKRIFAAAEHMLAKLLAVQKNTSLEEGITETHSWRKVYVGDDYDKDIVGATNAGWDAVFLDTCDAIKPQTLPLRQSRSPNEVEKEVEVMRITKLQYLASYLAEGS